MENIILAMKIIIFILVIITVGLNYTTSKRLKQIAEENNKEIEERVRKIIEREE